MWQPVGTLGAVRAASPGVCPGGSHWGHSLLGISTESDVILCVLVPILGISFHCLFSSSGKTSVNPITAPVSECLQSRQCEDTEISGFGERLLHSDPCARCS